MSERDEDEIRRAPEYYVRVVVIDMDGNIRKKAELPDFETLSLLENVAKIVDGYTHNDMWYWSPHNLFALRTELRVKSDAEQSVKKVHAELIDLINEAMMVNQYFAYNPTPFKVT